jgi:hypothetical protein
MLTPIELTEDEVQRLWSLYKDSYPTMGDINRSKERFQALLVDPLTQMFRVDESLVIYVSDMHLQWQATLHILTPEVWEVKPNQESLRADLKQLMAMFSLHRLFMMVPEPAKAIQKVARDLNFTDEGVMREAVDYDGKKTNIVVLGLLRRELEDARPEEETKPRSTLAERTFGKSKTG